ncbi:MAG: C/D box methylation guide ribonucleoprotein complex aNOP56 subunit [Promethearchaeota archaeon]
MNITVIPTAIGILALEQNKVRHFHPFSRNVEDVAKILLDLKNGLENDEIIDFFNGLDTKLKIDNISDYLLQTEDIFMYKLMNKNLSFTLQFVPRTEAGTYFRNNLPAMIPSMDMSMDVDGYYDLNRSLNVELTRLQIRDISEAHDKLVMQAINSIDDINKTTNIFSERIREWYGNHFPELTDRLISDHEFFLEILTEIGTRSEFTSEKLKELRPIQDPLVNKILKRAKESMGGKFTPYDIHVLQGFAKTVLELYKTRDELESYIESIMEQICPNMSVIIGAVLGARLICLAGGLENLAKKPSSTIQVLGAEKALFRAIKTKGDPPKHGVIFQSNYIRTAPYWQRGKIARLLAGKIAIAAKVDNISKRYIADDLLDDIHKKIENIGKKYPDAPKKKPQKTYSQKNASYKQGGKPRQRYQSSKYKGKSSNYHNKKASKSRSRKSSGNYKKR